MVTKTWVLMLDVIVVLQLDDGPTYHIMLHYDSAQRVGQQLSSNRLASRSATVGVTVGAWCMRWQQCYVNHHSCLFAACALHLRKAWNMLIFGNKSLLWPISLGWCTVTFSSGLQWQVKPVHDSLDCPAWPQLVLSYWQIHDFSCFPLFPSLGRRPIFPSVAAFVSLLLFNPLRFVTYCP